VVVRYAVRLNGLSGLAVTKLDVLDDCPDIKVCTGYRLDGRDVNTVPAVAEVFERCEPIYETLPGWKQPTAGITRYEDLPANARRYLDRLSDLVGCPHDVISTGSKRDQTIMRRRAFSA
jgi:adenylosuccinate synthase